MAVLRGYGRLYSSSGVTSNCQQAYPYTHLGITPPPRPYADVRYRNTLREGSVVKVVRSILRTLLQH